MEQVVDPALEKTKLIKFSQSPNLKRIILFKIRLSIFNSLIIFALMISLKQDDHENILQEHARISYDVRWGTSDRFITPVKR